MTTVKYADNCDLCGQPVEIAGFTLQTTQGARTFCCAGCQSIYTLIYGNSLAGLPDKVTGRSQITNNSNEDD